MGKKEEKNRRLFAGSNIRGQVWVETVIYTLIALTMIGAVLSFALPKVGDLRDKSVIDQSLNMMKDINNVILSVVQGGPGNKRVLDIDMRSGTLKIDGTADKISFEMETNYAYSEPGKTIDIGDVKAVTENVGGTKKVTLSSSYTYDIKYGGIDTEKDLAQSSVPYKVSIENKGTNADGKTIVDINLI